jgi:uncharacterized protein (DUF488 family)
MKVQLFTIGHSNRSFEDFLSLLKEFQIRLIADIRRYPSSRKFPHFNRETLAELLSAQGIQYVWFEALGGRRHTAPDKKSPNTGFKSPGYRNYADHMMTDEFLAAADELIALVKKLRTAIMCAEKFFWKCHRRLLSDFLYVQGITVFHILEHGTLQEHKLTQGMVVTDNGLVIYPQSNNFLGV